ncbi:MAG: hypothetical protein LQ349_005542 [Xanthoria aureola]|nr:MAG: hypothetical protein LQ349_005542 [Xanthoria aureola]
METEELATYGSKIGLSRVHATGAMMPRPCIMQREGGIFTNRSNYENWPDCS